MSMRCKQCGESFPKNQPFDVFELRRHKMLPADSDGMTHSDQLEDARHVLLAQVRRRLPEARATSPACSISADVGS